MREEIAFDSTLRGRLRSNLAGHDVRHHPLRGRRHAAVGVVVIDSDARLHSDDPTPIDREKLMGDTPGIELESFTGRIEGTAGGAAIILTRRGPRLSAHAGQWALPGGRVDEGEEPLEAAMREIAEEIRMAVGPVDLLGRLDDYPTRSGYVISPFVFWAPEGAEPDGDPAEVASVHRVAIGELLQEPRVVAIPQSERPLIQVPVGGDLIHAPTGAIMYQFRAVAYDGAAIRVDHFEQPVFAWE